MHDLKFSWECIDISPDGAVLIAVKHELLKTKTTFFTP